YSWPRKYQTNPADPASRRRPMRCVTLRSSATAFFLAGVMACAMSHAQAQSAIDLDHLTAAQAASDLCAGKYKSADLVAAVIARAKARPELNAFITLDEAGAMKAARAYDASHTRRASCKPLGGVPIAIKDNIEVAGLLA